MADANLPLPTTYKGVRNKYQWVFLPWTVRFLREREGHSFTGTCGELADAVHAFFGLNAAAEEKLPETIKNVGEALRLQGHEFGLRVQFLHSPNTRVPRTGPPTGADTLVTVSLIETFERDGHP